MNYTVRTVREDLPNCKTSDCEDACEAYRLAVGLVTEALRSAAKAKITVWEETSKDPAFVNVTTISVNAEKFPGILLGPRKPGELERLMDQGGEEAS